MTVILIVLLMLPEEDFTLNVREKTHPLVANAHSYKEKTVPLVDIRGEYPTENLANWLPHLLQDGPGSFACLPLLAHVCK